MTDGSLTHGNDEARLGRKVDPGPAAVPDRSTSLEGQHVRLVPIKPDRHADALFRASHGPDRDDLWRYLAPEPFGDLPAFRAYLDAAAAASDPLMLAILDRRTDEPVGHATYMRIEPRQRVIEIGNILFTPALQRTVGATEAIYLLARHAFDELGYRRLEWKCNALNAPSRRAALRYGFAFEGEFRQHMIVKGRNRDTTWFAMLDCGWPDRRRAFELWLSPGNFDASGRQRLSLGALNAVTIPGHALRRADTDDVAAFGALQAGAYAWNRRMLGVEPLPLLLSSADALARHEAWLLEENGTLVGALLLEPRPDDLLIWSISVDPERQNAGLGRRMLEAAEARARALGLSTIRLYTGAPLTKNIDWYTRRGYATEHVEAAADREVVHMVKNIDG